MIVTDFVNDISKNIDGLTEAGTALSTSIIGWVMFWRATAKLIPTEWKNPFMRWVFGALNLIAKCLGLDFPDIAKVDWKHFRIVTKQEVMATKVVNAAVVAEAVIENPPPPAVQDVEHKV